MLLVLFRTNLEEKPTREFHETPNRWLLSREISSHLIHQYKTEICKLVSCTFRRIVTTVILFVTTAFYVSSDTLLVKFWRVLGAARESAWYLLHSSISQNNALTSPRCCITLRFSVDSPFWSSQSSKVKNNPCFASHLLLANPRHPRCWRFSGGG